MVWLWSDGRISMREQNNMFDVDAEDKFEGIGVNVRLNLLIEVAK